jgi:Na+-translocating ferredoxin:NAD+ oxidoreductase RnfE subunit
MAPSNLIPSDIRITIQKEVLRKQRLQIGIIEMLRNAFVNNWMNCFGIFFLVVLSVVMYIRTKNKKKSEKKMFDLYKYD